MVVSHAQRVCRVRRLKDKHLAKGHFEHVDIGNRRTRQGASGSGKRSEAAARLRAQAAAKRVKQTPAAAPSGSESGLSGGEPSDRGNDGASHGEASSPPIILSDSESEGHRVKKQRKAERPRGAGTWQRRCGSSQTPALRRAAWGGRRCWSKRNSSVRRRRRGGRTLRCMTQDISSIPWVR